MTSDGKKWQGQFADHREPPRQNIALPPPSPPGAGGMPTPQQRRTSLSEDFGTDDDIPALQSPSDSSESEDEPIPPPQPQPPRRRPIVRPPRPLANVFDSDDSDIDITESGTVLLPLDLRGRWLMLRTLIPASPSPDVRFARRLLRQFQDYTNPPTPLPNQPNQPNQPPADDSRIESSGLLEALFLSSSSEDEDDRDNRRSQSRSQRTGTASSEITRHQIIQQFVSFISNRMRDHDAEREPDHLRAHAVIDGLEPVSKELLSRYEVVRGEDHPQRRAQCAVCYEPLDLEPPRSVEDRGPAEPTLMENKNLSLALPYHAAFPEVVAFPCLHIFHSECLLPWLARKTTCPTCRFDVDPDSLTLKGGCTQRPWVPPVDGVLEAWVQVEEVKKLTHVGGGS